MECGEREPVHRGFVTRPASPLRGAPEVTGLEIDLITKVCALDVPGCWPKKKTRDPGSNHAEASLAGMLRKLYSSALPLVLNGSHPLPRPLRPLRPLRPVFMNRLFHPPFPIIR